MDSSLTGFTTITEIPDPEAYISMSGIFEYEFQILYFYKTGLHTNITEWFRNAYEVHSKYAICEVRSQEIYFSEANAKSGNPLNVHRKKKG